MKDFVPIKSFLIKDYTNKSENKTYFMKVFSVLKY